MKYDTAEIRRVARQVEGCATSISTIESKEVKPIAASIPGEFEGEAATELTQVVTRLGADLRKLQQGISAISESLFIYARQLDEADARAKADIQSH